MYQFARAARHREVAEELLAAGKAYHCYASPDELNDMREAARRGGQVQVGPPLVAQVRRPALPPADHPGRL